VRLARNLADFRYPAKASLLERKKIFNQVSAAVEKVPQCRDFTHLNFAGVEKIHQQFLFENRVVSSELLHAEGDRGVIWGRGGRAGIMVNEEDHVRMQCIGPGHQPEALWEDLNSIDDELGKYIPYAYDAQHGFLTACPTNSGTGFRVSFLMHLPGLVLTKTIDQVLAGASQLGISTRGFFGEHSAVVGNFFQLSNQATMGACEKEFLHATQDIINKIITYENTARNRIINEAPEELADKVCRAYGILKYARSLELDEFFNLTSAIRLGIECGIIKNLNREALNRMIIVCLPAHLELYLKRRVKEADKAALRAAVVKKMLPKITAA